MFRVSTLGFITVPAGPPHRGSAAALGDPGSPGMRVPGGAL